MLAAAALTLKARPAKAEPPPRKTIWIGHR
jgi:hypothetical protein